MNPLKTDEKITTQQEFSVSNLVQNYSRLGTLHILIADDSASDRELFTQLLLEDDSNAYIITVASLGLQAYELCMTENFDCILLDYFLPDLVGIEFLNILKERNLDIPVIMLTGHGNESLAVEVFHHDAADYIPKHTVSTESLKRSITNAVEKNQLKRKIEKQNRQLAKKHEEISRFYHTVSHELKTPLTSMKEFVSIMLDGIAGPISEDQKEYLGYVSESCMQMTNDINDLLDVTRIETGKFRIKPVPIDINDIIKLVSQLMKPIAEGKGVSIILDLHTDLGEVLADHRRIEQVLTNLLSNAIKFTDTGGRVTIESRIDSNNSNSVGIVVKDTGCGIDKEEIDKLFNRLYQVESESDSLGSDKSSEAGLGLGLTITKEIIELHSGHIWVTSNVGCGSEFSFTLPRS